MDTHTDIHQKESLAVEVNGNNARQQKNLTHIPYHFIKKCPKAHHVCVSASFLSAPCFLSHKHTPPFPQIRAPLRFPPRFIDTGPTKMSPFPFPIKYTRVNILPYKNLFFRLVKLSWYGHRRKKRDERAPDMKHSKKKRDAISARKDIIPHSCVSFFLRCAKVAKDAGPGTKNTHTSVVQARIQ